MISNWAEQLVSGIHAWATRQPARQRPRSPRMRLGVDFLEARRLLAVVAEQPVDSATVHEDVAAEGASMVANEISVELVQNHRPLFICRLSIPFSRFDAVTAIAGNGSVSLRWDPEAQPAFRYRPSHVAIQYSADGSNWIDYPVALANSGRATVYGLSNGTAYSFRLSANLGTIPSRIPWTETGTTTAAVTPRAEHDSPTLVSAVATDRGFRLRWQPPAESAPNVQAGRPTPGRVRPNVIGSGYQIRFSADGGVTWRSRMHHSQVPQTVLRGLPTGTHLVFQVAAIRGGARGAFGNSIVSGRLEPPSEPLGLQVTRRPVEFSRFTLDGKLLEQRRSPFDFVEWNNPAKLSSMPIKNYIVEMSLDGLTWTTHSRPTRPETRHLGVGRAFEVAIDPPNGSGGYFVRVAAETTAGIGRFAVLKVH